MDLEKMGYDSGLGEEGGSYEVDVCWAPPPSTASSPEPLSDDSDPLFVPLNTSSPPPPSPEPLCWRSAPLEIIYEHGLPPAPSRPSRERVRLLSLLSRDRTSLARARRLHDSHLRIRLKYGKMFFNQFQKEQDIAKPSLQDIAKKFSSLSV